MLPFTRAAGIRKDHSDIFPQSISGHFSFDIVSNPISNAAEESSTWSDHIRIEGLLVDILLYIADVFVFLSVVLQQL